MQILMTGGTGFIGKPLCRKLASLGHRVTVITRHQPDLQNPGAEAVDYFVADLSAEASLPASLVEQTDVVINLVGESIGGRRWTRVQKIRLLESRIRPTKMLVEAIAKAQAKPKAFISSSAVGYYGPHGDEELDESATVGDDFLAGICAKWEAEVQEVTAQGTRLVIMRTGVVFGRGGGALQQMMLPFKLFAGGPLGSGKQWLSWIHLEDLLEFILFAITDESVHGPVNVTSPSPVTNKEFTKILGKALKRPSFMPTPAFALKAVLGEQASIILTGQRVLPRKARELGFRFKYAEVQAALQEILG